MKILRNSSITLKRHISVERSKIFKYSHQIFYQGILISYCWVKQMLWSHVLVFSIYKMHVEVKFYGIWMCSYGVTDKRKKQPYKFNIKSLVYTNRNAIHKLYISYQVIDRVVIESLDQ